MGIDIMRLENGSLPQIGFARTQVVFLGGRAVSVVKQFLFRALLDNECRGFSLMTDDFGIGGECLVLSAVSQLHVGSQ